MKSGISPVVWIALVLLLCGVSWKFIGSSSKPSVNTPTASTTDIEDANQSPAGPTTKPAEQEPDLKEQFAKLPGNDHVRVRRFKGGWGKNLEKPNGIMIGTVWPDDKEEGLWHAAFAPYARGRWLAQVSMDGHEEEGIVKFEGEAYFSKAEEYTWVGRMTGEQFSGEYIMKRNEAKGAFMMTPVALEE